MQRSARFGGDGAQVAGGGGGVAHHFVDRAFRSDAYLLDEVLCVLGGGVGALEGLAFRAILESGFVRGRLSVRRARLDFGKDLVADAVDVQRSLGAVERKAMRAVVEPTHAVILQAGRTAADAMAVYPRSYILHDEARILVRNHMQIEDVARVFGAE